MSRDTSRGQASIEMIAACLMVLVVAFGGWDMLRALQARDTAHRMVDQAAVLTPGCASRPRSGGEYHRHCEGVRGHERSRRFDVTAVGHTR